jgi:hypothetical protein
MPGEMEIAAGHKVILMVLPDVFTHFNDLGASA